MTPSTILSRARRVILKHRHSMYRPVDKPIAKDLLKPGTVFVLGETPQILISFRRSDDTWRSRPIGLPVGVGDGIWRFDTDGPYTFYSSLFIL